MNRICCCVFKHNTGFPQNIEKDTVSHTFCGCGVQSIHEHYFEAWASNPGCATKVERCKNLAFNIGDCVPLMAQIPCKAVGPMYIRRTIPEQVKKPGCLSQRHWSDTTITRLAVKLHRHCYHWMCVGVW